MSWLQLLQKTLVPTKIKCAQGFDADMPFDPTAMGLDTQEDAEVFTGKQPKVPTFEHLMNSVIMITGRIDFIKGFKFDVSFPLSEYFNFSHSWVIPNSGTEGDRNPFNSLMPSMSKPTYTFTTQLVRDIKSPTEHPGIVMLGKVDSEGKVDAILLKKINKNINARFSGSFQTSNVEQGMLGVDLDIEGKNSMTVLRMGPGHFGLNFMQRIHKNLMLGFDYSNLLAQKMSFFSYGMKAFINNHTLYAQYIAIQQQMNLAYVVPIKKGTSFVSHWRYDKRENKSTTIIGFKQRYQQSEILGTINSRAKITTILTLKTPTYGLKLCALIDYMREKYTFGYGITIGQVG